MRTGPLAAVVLTGLLAAPSAEAAASTKPQRTPRRPPASFSVSVARFEARDPGGTVRVDGVGDYRGILELRRGPAGVGAVNEVPFEDYLKGISEMPSGWPAEALRAQVIAARTYALYVLEGGLAGSAGDLAAQICATEGCQVYAGLAKEQAPKGANWAAAVEATKGQVLLFQNKPIQAKYSSSNGGRSVAGAKPYLKAVDDPDDARSPLHRWTLDVSFDDLGHALGAPGPVTGVSRAGNGDIDVAWEQAVEPPADPQPSPAEPAAAEGAPGTEGTPAEEAPPPPAGETGHLVVTPPDFRTKVNAALPPPPGRSRTVPSPLFNLSVAGRTVHLEGRGYGHGIGMSQWGAYGKALRGMSAAGILASYYGGLKPVPLAPGRLPDHVRVAVDPGRPELAVSAEKPFRVLDGDGKVVAELASGTWKVVLGSTGLRLLPPPGQAGSPVVELLGIDPPSPAVGEPATVRFRSTVPALVSVKVQPPGGVEAQILAAHPAASEEVSVALPPARNAGPYLVWLSAEAGTDRLATQLLMPRVSGPAGAATGQKWSPPGATPDRPLAARVSRSSATAPPGTAAGVSAPSVADRWASLAALTVGALLALVYWSRRRALPKAPAPKPTYAASAPEPDGSGSGSHPE